MSFQKYCFFHLNKMVKTLIQVLSFWDNQRHCENKMKLKVLVSQSTLWDPMNCRPPGSSVHGILQARTLEWVVIPFSGGSSQPRDWTQVSCIEGRFFTIWAIKEAQLWKRSVSNFWLPWNHYWDMENCLLAKICGPRVFGYFFISSVTGAPVPLVC